MTSQASLSVRILLAGLLLAALAARADAETDCDAAPGVRPEIESFLTRATAAQAAGTGTMPIDAVLFGVTGIDAEDRGELDARAQVELTRRTATGGDYVNQGPARITVEGMFAAHNTLFRLPKLVLGRYRLERGGAVLTYDPAHTVEVGERVLGIPIFMEVHRMSVTPQRLAFFFAGNDSDDPDRCYTVD